MTQPMSASEENNRNKLLLQMASKTIGDLQKEIDRLRAENEKYRKALEFYAEGKHFHIGRTDDEFEDEIYIIDDVGRVAREALGGKPCSSAD